MDTVFCVLEGWLEAYMADAEADECSLHNDAHLLHNNAKFMLIYYTIMLIYYMIMLIYYTIMLIYYTIMLIYYTIRLIYYTIMLIYYAHTHPQSGIVEGSLEAFSTDAEADECLLQEQPLQPLQPLQPSPGQPVMPPFLRALIVYRSVCVYVCPYMYVSL